MYGGVYHSHVANMITFKKYPPTFIPLKYWVCRVNKEGQVEYLVIQTLIAWARNKSQTCGYDHSCKRQRELFGFCEHEA